MEIRARVLDALREGRKPTDLDGREEPRRPLPTRVLLVEEDPDQLALISQTLAGSELAFELDAVARFDEALAALEGGGFDAVVVDVARQDGRGATGVRRACSLASHLPVVVLSGSDDPGGAVRAMRSGVQDYRVKAGLDRAELPGLILRAIERHGPIHEDGDALAAPDAPISERVDDPDTGLLSERGFAAGLARALARAALDGRAFSVLQIDIDASTDSRVGIEVDELITSAHALGDCIRWGDSLGRLADHRFAVVLNGADGTEALHGACGVIVDALTQAFDDCVGGRSATRVLRVYGTLIRDPAVESPTSVMALARRSPLAVVEVRDPERDAVLWVGRTAEAGGFDGEIG